MHLGVSRDRKFNTRGVLILNLGDPSLLISARSTIGPLEIFAKWKGNGHRRVRMKVCKFYKSCIVAHKTCWRVCVIYKAKWRMLRSTKWAPSVVPCANGTHPCQESEFGCADSLVNYHYFSYSSTHNDYVKVYGTRFPFLNHIIKPLYDHNSVCVTTLWPHFRLHRCSAAVANIRHI